MVRATGTLTKTQVVTIVHDWCQSNDKEATCLAARYLLALDELDAQWYGVPEVTATLRGRLSNSAMDFNGFKVGFKVVRTARLCSARAHQPHLGPPGLDRHVG